MKISVITVCYNSSGTIGDTINSVLAQTYKNLEYIIVDGGSSDGTRDIVMSFGGGISKFISEPDKGIYDAMNKGLKLATGDIVATLNSDDIYADNTALDAVASALKRTQADTCYGDLCYVDRADTNRVIRYWKAGDYRPDNFRRGWMPPHPTFFAKRKLFDKYGGYDLRFPIAADYELMLRFLYGHRLSAAHISKVLVKMRAGGTSSPGLITTARAIRENYAAWRVNGLKPALATFALKPLSKILQYAKHYD